MPLLRPVAFAAALACLAACSDNAANRPVPSASKAAPDTAAVRKAAQEFRVQYNQPVDLDSTDFYFLPISIVPLEASIRSRAFSSDSYDSGSKINGIEGTCYNLVFLQKSTLTEHLLLPHSRFVISDINTAMKPAARSPYLFYTIIQADTNGDGKQNDEDASTLFASDRSGRQLYQLTPDGADLVSWRILSKTNILLAEVRPDVNKDRKFTHADGTYWLRFNLQNLQAAPAQQPTAPLTRQLHQQMLDRLSRQLR